jgi:hypothetical protein
MFRLVLVETMRFRLSERMKVLLIACFSVFVSTSIGAQVIIQSFESSWSVDVSEYDGQLSARKWEYQTYNPWDGELGELQEVDINISITGTKSSADELRIGAAFFTGWGRAYQFTANHPTVEEGQATFSNVFEWQFGGDGLGPWLSADTFPQAHYFFESRTIQFPHSIDATTTLTYRYTAVPEPDEWISIAGFGIVLFVVIRRRCQRSNRLKIINPTLD